MRIRLYTEAERARHQEAAREAAENFALAGEEVMETLIGAAFITERKGIKLAVIIAQQDENGPLFR